MATMGTGVWKGLLTAEGHTRPAGGATAITLLSLTSCPHLLGLRATSRSWAAQESLGEPEYLVLCSLHVVIMQKLYLKLLTDIITCLWLRTTRCSPKDTDPGALSL